MHPMNLTTGVLVLMMVITMTVLGCNSDGRLAEYAQRATEQQARQNERMAEQAQAVTRQSQELTSAAHELVEHDAAARRDLLQAQDRLQQKVQEERSGLDRQQQELHDERKSVAAAAIRNPVIAEAIITSGLILAALLPLLVTAYALRRLPDRDPVDDLLANALLENLGGQRFARPRESLTESLPDGLAPRMGRPGQTPTAGSDDLPDS